MPSSAHRPTSSGPERRRFARFDTRDLVVGHLTKADLPVRVRDLGLGGFSVETVEPLEPGLVHDVQFIAHDDWTTTVRARTVHTHPTVAADGTPRYATGFSFVSASAVKADVESLIQKITNVQFFDAER